MTTQESALQAFDRLLEEGRGILKARGWDGRDYQRSPRHDDYFRMRTQALNLVSRICGEGSEHHRELRRLAENREPSTNSYYLAHVLGVVEAARHDLEHGLLIDLRALIAAELLGDFMDQAQALLQAGYHVPAASLAGAVLEDSLRKLSQTRNVTLPDKTNIDRLNAELAKAGAYDTLIQKRITALADVRNNADHGRFDRFTREDVDDMVKWVRRFTADYLH